MTSIDLASAPVKTGRRDLTAALGGFPAMGIRTGNVCTIVLGPGNDDHDWASVGGFEVPPWLLPVQPVAFAYGFAGDSTRVGGIYIDHLGAFGGSPDEGWPLADSDTTVTFSGYLTEAPPRSSMPLSARSTRPPRPDRAGGGLTWPRSTSRRRSASGRLMPVRSSAPVPRSNSIGSGASCSRPSPGPRPVMERSRRATCLPRTLHSSDSTGRTRSSRPSPSTAAVALSPSLRVRRTSRVSGTPSMHRPRADITWLGVAA